MSLWDNSWMDMRTVITLTTIVIVLGVSFAFLIFNPSAQKARQQNVESSAQELVKESKLTDKKPQ